MRYREFTINIPINIRLNGDGEPSIEVDNEPETEVDPEELDQDPIFVPPLQQQIELAKAGKGKDSKVIDKLTADGIQDEPEEPEEIGAPQTNKRFR